MKSWKARDSRLLLGIFISLLLCRLPLTSATPTTTTDLHSFRLLLFDSPINSHCPLLSYGTLEGRRPERAAACSRRRTCLSLPVSAIAQLFLTSPSRIPLKPNVDNHRENGLSPKTTALGSGWYTPELLRRNENAAWPYHTPKTG